jgi:hypothetical protein
MNLPNENEFDVPDDVCIEGMAGTNFEFVLLGNVDVDDDGDDDDNDG